MKEVHHQQHKPTTCIWKAPTMTSAGVPSWGRVVPLSILPCTASSPGIYGVYYCKADPGIIYHTCISLEESRYGQIQLFWPPVWTEGCLSRKEHLSILNKEASIFPEGLSHLSIQSKHPNFNHHPSITSSRTVIIFHLFSQLIQYLPFPTLEKSKLVQLGSPLLSNTKCKGEFLIEEDGNKRWRWRRANI